MNNQLKHDHYVYGLYDLTGKIKYIGSGRGIRKDSTSKRKAEFINILNSGGFIHTLVENLNRKEAVRIENELLSLYRHQLINTNKRVRLLDYKFDYFDKFLALSNESPTGLVWKVHMSSKVRKGSNAGRNNKGYFIVTIKRNIYQVHRVLYCLRNNIDLSHDQIINHIDFNPANNAEDNLEVVSIRVNCIKRSGYDGKEVGVVPRPSGVYSKIALNGVEFGKMFTYKEFGNSLARVCAIEFKNKMLSVVCDRDEKCIEADLINLGAEKLTTRNIINGVRYRGGTRNCFESYGVVNGVLKTRHFSINKYGFEEAKRLAEEVRQSFILTSIN